MAERQEADRVALGGCFWQTTVARCRLERPVIRLILDRGLPRHIQGAAPTRPYTGDPCKARLMARLQNSFYCKSFALRVSYCAVTGATLSRSTAKVNLNQIE